MEDRHPYASQTYARALASDSLTLRYVPEWGTHLLVHEAPSGAGPRRASGLYPYASLDPACDVAAGLETLKRDGIGFVSLVLDPLWSPPLEACADAFDVCKPFKTAYMIDRARGPVRFRKKHRNRINRSNRRCQVRLVALSDYADRAFEMYEQFSVKKQIAGETTFTQNYFRTVSGMNAIRTIAAFVDSELVAISLWLRFRARAYFLLGFSNEQGYAISASYAYHDFAIRHFADCRHLNFGSEVGLSDSPEYATSGFKSGFANATAQIHVCGASFLEEGSSPIFL